MIQNKLQSYDYRSADLRQIGWHNFSEKIKQLITILKSGNTAFMSQLLQYKGRSERDYRDKAVVKKCLESIENLIQSEIKITQVRKTENEYLKNLNDLKKIIQSIMKSLSLKSGIISFLFGQSKNKIISTTKTPAPK